ncbi:MAG: ABC transporter permease [Candidatus Diapherotrites archaeon]|nr:ABC transporter permease [Candidatus Diapherotrites archaeon]
MIDLELVRRGFGNIKNYGLRSALTILGIIVAVALIVALISISNGFSASIDKQFESFGTNTLIVMPGKSSMEGMFAKLQEGDGAVIEKVSRVKLAVEIFTSSVDVTFKGETKRTPVYGGSRKNFSNLEFNNFITIGEGALIQKQSGLLVGGKFATEKFDKEITLGSMLQLGGKEFNVVGILKTSQNFTSSMFSSAILMDSDELKKIQPSIVPSRIFVKFDDTADVEEIKDKITKKLKDAHGKEDFRIVDSKQLAQSATSVLGTIQVVVLGIAFISLLVGAIGVMNLMFMNVSNRTKEIGTMKAIGATNYQVMVIFLTEAMLIGTIGGLIGATIGIAVGIASEAVANAAGFELIPVMGIDLILFAIFFAGIIGILSGVLPAIRASRLDPVDAIRQSN